MDLNQKIYSKGNVPNGYKCAPGNYTATIYKEIAGVHTQITDPISFEVVPLYKSSIKEDDFNAVAEYGRELERLDIYLTATTRSITNGVKRVTAMQNALTVSAVKFDVLYTQLEELREEFYQLELRVGSNKSKTSVGAKSKMNLWGRYGIAQNGGNTTYGPTIMQLDNMAIAKEEHEVLRSELEVLLNEKIPQMEKALEKAGAPWIQGMPLPQKQD